MRTRKIIMNPCNHISRLTLSLKAILLCSLMLCVGCGITAKRHIFVVDQEGKPIPNARVDAHWEDYLYIPSFSLDFSGKGGGGSGGSRSVDGRTNQDGYFSFWIIDGLEQIYATAYHDAHYQSNNRKHKEEDDTDDTDDTLIVTLRKKQEPVILTGKQVKLFLTNEVTIRGYDLVVGDWVKPYGRGIVDDLQISATVTPDEINDRPWYLKPEIIEIAFPHEGDGMQLFFWDSQAPYVEWWFPYHAPTEGYHATLSQAYEQIGVDSDAMAFSNIKHSKLSSEKLSYWNWLTNSYTLDASKEELLYMNMRAFFRIRTDTNTPYYGMIIEQFDIGTIGGAPTIEFSYFFNPNHTTNLECKEITPIKLNHKYEDRLRTFTF